MTFNHKRVECKHCGAVIMQCRCIEPTKIVEKSVCADCAKAGKS